MKNQGILTANALINWKRNNGALKVSVPPKYVILCPRQVLPSFYKLFFLKQIKGIMGRHVCVNEQKGIYLSTGWGIGGAALVAICEELYVLGVRNFILVGPVGRLSTSISEMEIRYAKTVFREEGTSSHYLSEQHGTIIDCPSDIYFQKFAKLGFESARFISTDAPFRETVEKCSKWRKAGCTLIDMETAALYAFAKYYCTNAVSIGIGADSVAHQEWMSPKNLKELDRLVKKTVFQLLDTLE